jgi:hypothetical protein
VTKSESKVNPEEDIGFETAHSSYPLFETAHSSYPLYDVNGDFKVNDSLIYLFTTNSNITYKYSAEVFGKGKETTIFEVIRGNISIT